MWGALGVQRGPVARACYVGVLAPLLLVGCAHGPSVTASPATVTCPNGEQRVLMRCEYTSDRIYAGGVAVDLGQIRGDGSYQETQADQENDQARVLAMGLQSMCIEYNACVISSQEYKTAKYNFEGEIAHLSSLPWRRAPAAREERARKPESPAPPSEKPKPIAKRPAPAHPHLGKWYDAPRELTLWYVCERPERGRCADEGWSGFDGSCYQVSESLKTYDAAVASCRSKRAHLVTIESAAENRHVAALSERKTCWIGLAEPPGSEDWFWANGRAVGREGAWTGYTNWNSHEPNNHGGRDEDATLMNFWGHLGMPEPWAKNNASDHLGKWYDAPRELTLWYVCERPERGRCADEGWSSFDGSCYQFSESLKTYDAAVASCRSKRAHLVTIESAAENRHVAALSERRTCWIGLAEPPGSEDWFWVNGRAVGREGAWTGYTNWNSHEPNNHGGRDEDATLMNFWGHLGMPEPWRQ